MMSSGGRSRYPFTVSQWQELEYQALVYKYMISGMPIPPDLLFTIRRSLDSSLSSNFLLHQPHTIGWTGFQMGFGRKIDPEPGRCRRTDGKKWRCSKEAYPDSKYCERHMHRGRNRSRKPVEVLSQTTTTTTTAVPSITKKSVTLEPHFLYPHFSCFRPAGIGLSSSQENTTKFFLESNAYDSHSPGKDYRDIDHGQWMKGESDEQAFISDHGSSVNDSCWQLAPLTMGSSLSQMKDKAYSSSGLESGHQNIINHDHQHYYNSDLPLNTERDDGHHSKKVMHHFLDEWSPKEKDSWPSSEDKLSSQRTQLSMSIPNSLHDFFMTQKW